MRPRVGTGIGEMKAQGGDRHRGDEGPGWGQA